MSERTGDADGHEEPIAEVLGRYLEAAEAGRAPSLAELLAQHPDLAGELTVFFDQQERFALLVAPLREAAGAVCEDEPTLADPQARMPSVPARQARHAEHARPDPRETLDVPPPTDGGGADGGGGGGEDGATGGGDADEPLARGTRARYFGDYELHKVLGRGGMGIVYRARQISLNRPVALKMLKSDVLATEDERRRFQNEAEAVALLDHPHIVPILEVGEHEGRRYFSMKLIAGSSLERKLEEYASDPKAAARLLATVAEAVHHAHQRGILHRDLKPANILLDDRGRPHVTDFGLAKRVEGDSEMTQSGAILGTPAYMSPEQASGRRGAVTTASDVYGLGAVLYALLAGRAPFVGDTVMDTIQQVRERAPVPPSKLNHRTPSDLEVICLKCLEKDAARRYGSAQALADDLHRYLAGEPITARRTGSRERAWLWCKRNPGLAVANITAAVLTTVLAIGSTSAAWIYRDQRNTLETEQGKTQANLTRALSAEKGARDQLDQTQKAERQARLAQGQSLVSEGAALQRTGLIGQRFESLDRLGQAAQILGADPEGRKQLPEIRNQAIAALGLTDLCVSWQRDFGDVGVSVDAALERYAVMEPSGGAVVRRLDDDRELVRLPPPDRRDFWYAQSEFSPDGELLVARYGLHDVGAMFQIWHLASREPLLSRSGSEVLGLAFHPDGRHLACRAPEGGIAVWDRVERRMVRRLLSDLTPRYQTWTPLQLAFDPEGRRLAVNSADQKAQRVMIVEFETGRPLADWTSQVGFGGLGWSADGQLLAVGSQVDDPCVYVWNVRRKTLASVLLGHTHSVIGAQFAHSGYLLATTGFDNTTRLWDAASGEHLATAPGNFMRFSPDDRQLAIGTGGTLGVWEVAAGTECRTLHPGMQSADFSPDGRLLATCGDGVHLWEADTGRELAHLESGHCTSVLFHTDGQSLISAGEWGLYRWPIRPDPDRGADALRVGPPELLREATGLPWLANEWTRAAWLPDHRTLAFADNPGARILLVDSSHPHPAWSRAAALDAGGNHYMFTVAVSPDGRWLAAGGWSFAGIRVWDLRQRRLVHNWRPRNRSGAEVFLAGFSPDGRWLISCAGPEQAVYHFWRVGTWDLERRIDQERNGIAVNPPAFTADGRQMALGIAPDQVLLADAATGRELARLTTLQPIIPTPLVFSPDGTKLIASTTQKTALMWDLRRIRAQLARMGLDWDAPPYPVASAASEAPGPVPPPKPVRVVGEVIEPQARRAGERAEMNRRLAANPDDADALIHRGWLFLQETRWLARRADYPDDADVLTRLGRLFLQQKKWPEAIADLERLARLRPDDADACWLLGESYEEAGNPAGALAAFSRRLERAPEDRDARFQRGLLALALAQPEVAEDDFRRILAAESDLERVRYRRAQALIHLGRHGEALADLDTLIAKDPNDFALYQLRSIVREALGGRDPARADREKASSLLPKDPTELNDAACEYVTGPIDRRDPERAVTLARRSVELAPGQPPTLFTLGVALYRAGQYVEAISVLERGMAAGKGELDAFDLLFLAMAHHRLGHAAEARDCFDRAVRWWIEPKNLPAEYIRNLTAFRAEAEAVLGLTSPIGELPADVFAPEPRDRP